jgi:hypothetical protein
MRCPRIEGTAKDNFDTRLLGGFVGSNVANIVGVGSQQAEAVDMVREFEMFLEIGM